MPGLERLQPGPGGNPGGEGQDRPRLRPCRRSGTSRRRSHGRSSCGAGLSRRAPRSRGGVRPGGWRGRRLPWPPGPRGRPRWGRPTRSTPHPARGDRVFKSRQVRRFSPDLAERNLMRPPGAFHRNPVDLLGTGPPLRRPQHDHRPARPRLAASVAGPSLDGGDVVEGVVQRSCQQLVHLRRSCPERTCCSGPSPRPRWPSA